jgi:8-oxo-dGTP pyrophosphatase MutT (NUDIX family)
MLFNNVLGIQAIDRGKVNINHREAVRAVVFRDNEILMVHNNKGDYKFPGGGINKEESHEEALKREVKEETGYIVDCVKNRIGVITERRQDEYDRNSIFEMVSHYYLCEISGDRTNQQLDDYEFELGFQPVWITLDEAIQLNEEILKKNEDMNAWVDRDTSVLRTLKKSCNSREV